LRVQRRPGRVARTAPMTAMITVRISRILLADGSLHALVS
jgi:hypothetical protein